MKTLFEQFKEDIKPMTKSSDRDIFINGLGIDLIKESYLNSIDCMIEWITNDYNFNKLYNNTVSLIYIQAQVNIMNYLKEQRNLIKNND